MAVSNGEMEASVIVKWPMAMWRSERKRECREREREFDRMRKKKGAHVLTFCFFFIDGFSVGNNLMK